MDKQFGTAKKSSVGELVRRGKELIIDQPGRTAARGIEQLRKGEFLKGAGNIALSPLQMFGGTQRFVFGDPARSVAKDVGFTTLSFFGVVRGDTTTSSTVRSSPFRIR